MEYPTHKDTKIVTQYLCVVVNVLRKMGADDVLPPIVA